MAVVQQGSQPVLYMQGIAVPASSVRPEEFFAKTRRHIYTEKTVNYAGQSQDVVELRKSDILSGMLVRFVGSVVVAGAGTATSTARWPYDFLRQVRFTANGASNIINCSGLKLKARDVMKRGEYNDRGVSQTVGGTTKTQGTLSAAHEAWGVGSQSTLTNGTYPVEIDWWVPVAEDDVDLAGAIFLATSSSDLTLTLDYETGGNLFVVTGGSTVTMTGQVQILSTKYSIPLGSDGQIVVPNLNVFHSMIQSRQAAGIAVGENELRLVGQGAGKSLLRVFYQFFNGTTPAPLAMNSTNFGKQSWRYGNNETPDELIDGGHMRALEERNYGSDLGGIWGFGCHEFASENAFRDVVDMGTTSELRLVATIQNGVALVNPAVEYVTETVFLAGQGA